MKTVIPLLILLAGMQNNSTVGASNPNENQEIATKIKNFTDDLQKKGGLKIAEDINEFREDEAVFDEMFSHLRNFLSPYTGNDERAISTSIEKIKNNATKMAILPKYVNSSNCTNNSSFKRPDYIQIWFMMHLPKKPNDEQNKLYNIEHWIERFFEELLHNFNDERNEIDEVQTTLLETTQKTTLNDQTHHDLTETAEVTADFHVMLDTESTVQVTTKNQSEKKPADENAINIWSINKKKRSVILENERDKKNAINIEPDFLKLFGMNNQLRSKRIKRDITADEKNITAESALFPIDRMTLAIKDEEEYGNNFEEDNEIVREIIRDPFNVQQKEERTADAPSDIVVYKAKSAVVKSWWFISFLCKMLSVIL